MAEKREIRFNLWPQVQNDDLDLMGQKKRNFFVKLFKSFEVALKFLSKRIALKEWMENLALGKYYTFFYISCKRKGKGNWTIPIVAFAHLMCSNLNPILILDQQMSGSGIFVPTPIFPTRLK